MDGPSKVMSEAQEDPKVAPEGEGAGKFLWEGQSLTSMGTLLQVIKF